MTVIIERSVYTAVKYADGHPDIGDARQVHMFNHCQQNEPVLPTDLCLCNTLAEQNLKNTVVQNASIASEDDTQSESKSSDSCESITSDDCDDSIEDDRFTNLPLSPNDVDHVLLNLKEVLITSDSVFAKESDNNTTYPVNTENEYRTLHITYLLITLVIMLADGLQGTHLYDLYESYGFSVASLYCLGFVTGGLASPITGPLVDKIGRKKAAILYCVLEMFINRLEQYPYLLGLIVSRMIGGITTNLLSTVFETWLDTEYRRRGFAKEKYEIIMRDSVIVSNIAAIFSGYLAHSLAENYGAVGPFQGAVTCTFIALIVVCFVWTENYGSADEDDTKDMIGYFNEAVVAFKNDAKMRCVGLLQGLTAGCVQTFVFLWAPTLRQLALNAPSDTWGLDKEGKPAYGLIFGAFMGAGVLGGLVAPSVRKFVTSMLTPVDESAAPTKTVEIESEGHVIIRPMAVEFLAASCYFLSAGLLAVPYFVSASSSTAFSTSLLSLLVFELLIGIFLPCEGVIRSLYFPSDARASIMTLPRIIVNAAVALGVFSTNFIEFKTAFFAVASIMAFSGVLQISLVSIREWTSLFGRVENESRRVSEAISEICRQSSTVTTSLSVQKVKES